MRFAASIIIMILAACSAAPVAPTFDPPDSAAAAQKIIRASYRAAIPRLAAANREDDKRTNATAAAISGKDYEFNVRQTAMMVFDEDAASGLKEMIKTDITGIEDCVWEEMRGDQHTADLFAVSTTHGYRCQLATRKEGMSIETCKRRMEKGKTEGYFFMAEDGMHYAPTPEDAFAPFGSNPWGACKGR